MSIQSAKALYTKLLVDEKFRRQLERAATARQRYDILQAAGFSCTPGELNLAKIQFNPYSIASDNYLGFANR